MFHGWLRGCGLAGRVPSWPVRQWIARTNWTRNRHPRFAAPGARPSCGHGTLAPVPVSDNQGVHTTALKTTGSDTGGAGSVKRGAMTHVTNMQTSTLLRMRPANV